MTSAFISALGGLKAHQSWIDVIGNNIANASTPGFKSSRALFANLLAVTLRPGSAPSSNLGGRNPLQVGLGVNLTSVDRLLEQGALNVTGRTFDLALLGNGYFDVTDGAQTLYTRVGTFGLDAEGNMVDLRTGMQVLDPNGQTFQIDTNAVVPPSATTSVEFAGNLPAVVTGPLAEVLNSSSSFKEGTVAQMAGSGSGPFVVPAGETWTMEIVVNGGAPQEVSIPAGSYSAAAVAAEIENQTENLQAAASSGQVSLTSDRAGLGSTIKVNAGEAGKDLKGLLGLGDFVQGTETPSTGTTDLNDLASNLTDYQVGDLIDVAGTDVDGLPVVASFAYGVDGTTIDDLVTFLDAEFPQSDVSFNATTGQITIQATDTGEAELSLTLSNGANQSGSTDWGHHFFAVTTNGSGPDTVTTSVETFDSVGTAHIVTIEYIRQDDGSWNAVASVAADEGTVNSGPINIRFSEEGSLQTPSSGTIEVQFNGLGAQEIEVNFGNPGGFDGLTQFGSPATAAAILQDGYGAGELANLQVGATGTVDGFYTNGQIRTLGSFGIATFANESALEDTGESYFRESSNTGSRVFGNGTVNGAGEVVGGAIEDSNVDTATEFVNLIQAQRGFQASARVITVQDDLLAEIVNVV